MKISLFDFLLRLIRVVYLTFIFQEEHVENIESGKSSYRLLVRRISLLTFGMLKRIGRTVLPLSKRDKLILWLFEKKIISEKCCKTAAPKVIRGRSGQYDFGINLIGFLRGQLGIGEAARASARAAVSSGIPVAGLEYKWKIKSARVERICIPMTDIPLYPVNLFHVNMDVFSSCVVVLGTDFFCNRFNIAYWMWETNEIPDDRVQLSVILTEIWTPSNFCKNALEKKVNIPVRVMPLNVQLEADPRCNREKLGLPGNGFIFLCVADFMSVVERKNPLAVIQAFSEVSKHLDNVYLVVKISNAKHRPDVMNTMVKYQLKMPSLILMTEDLDRGSFGALINNCDCVVSLHRAEGFGLVLAEAMFIGKPVIATGWSGNMDFMTEENSIPIHYELVEIEKDLTPYRRGSHWAEPVVDDAIKAMIKVASSPDYAYEIGMRGMADVRRLLSPYRSGIIMRSYLESLLQVNSGEKLPCR